MGAWRTAGCGSGCAIPKQYGDWDGYDGRGAIVEPKGAVRWALRQGVTIRAMGAIEEGWDEECLRVAELLRQIE